MVLTVYHPDITCTLASSYNSEIYFSSRTLIHFEIHLTIRSFIFHTGEYYCIPRPSFGEDFSLLTIEKSGPLNVVQKSPPNCESVPQHLQSELTPVDAFYIRNHFPSPKIDASHWKLDLVLDGFEKKVFSYEDLLSLPQKTVVATLECAGNGRRHFNTKVEGEIEWGDLAVSTAEWRGVSVADLVKSSSLTNDELDRVTEFIFIGADGNQNESIPLENKSKFVRSLPLQKAIDEDTIVALEMNGRPLPIDHGFPARVVVPGWYAMASVKWLKKILLSTYASEFQGYFNSTKYVYVTEENGSSKKDPITNLRVKSLIIYPEDGGSIPLGNGIVINGKAWSGFAKVSKVELDYGEGWYPVVLEKNESGSYSWISWQFQLVPKKKGSMTLRVRATDENGNMQPDLPQFNKYLYGYNAIQEIRISVT
jgi:DMSO/TMAO reductase YedYZ molybdopterin-dependent catalytic subunit